MAKCPECKKDIEFLKHFSKELVEYDFAFNSPEDTQPDYTCIRRYPEIAIDGTWECPECGKVLFTDEEEATTFLKPLFG